MKMQMFPILSLVMFGSSLASGAAFAFGNDPLERQRPEDHMVEAFRAENILSTSYTVQGADCVHHERLTSPTSQSLQTFRSACYHEESGRGCTYEWKGEATIETQTKERGTLLDRQRLPTPPDFSWLLPTSGAIAFRARDYARAWMRQVCFP